MIVELRDEACTLWASGWLTFRRKATKVFLGLDFNFQVLAEGEAEESEFDDEVDPMVLSDAPNSVPLPGKPEIETPAEADSLTSVVGTSPLTYMLLRALIKTFRLFPVVFAYFVNFEALSLVFP